MDYQSAFNLAIGVSAFFGGSLATSKNVHIKVDALTKLVERSKSKILHFAVKNIVTLF
jgi:TRAP-type C4-dicarboxylate transport system permease small subunit